MSVFKTVREVINEGSYIEMEEVFCREWQKYGMNYPAISVKAVCDSLAAQEPMESDKYLITYKYEDPFDTASGLCSDLDCAVFVTQSDLEELRNKYGADEYSKLLQKRIKSIYALRDSGELPDSDDSFDEEFFVPDEYEISELHWNEVANLKVYCRFPIMRSYYEQLAALLYRILISKFIEADFDERADRIRKTNEIMRKEAKTEPKQEAEEIESYEEEVSELTEEQEETIENTELSNQAHNLRGIKDLFDCYFSSEIEPRRPKRRKI